MLGPHLRAILASLIAGVLLLGACGNDDAPSAEDFDDPEEAVLAAFNRLEADTVAIAVSFDGTAAELAVALEAVDDFQDDPASRAAMELMADAELRMSGAGDDFAMAVVLSGDDLAEMRFVSNVFYGRLDIERGVEILRDIDADAAAEIEMVLAMAPMIAMEDPRLGFVSDMLAGQWISMDLPPEALDLLESGEQDEGLDEELLAVLQEIVADNTEVVHAGSARGGEQFIVTVDVATAMATAARNPMTAQGLDMSGVSTSPEDMIAEMQAEGIEPTWQFDVVLIDGQISSIRMDFAELATDSPEGVSLPILITFAPSPSAPSAPSDHTPIPAELLEEMMGDMMGGLGPLGM